MGILRLCRLGDRCQSNVTGNTVGHDVKPQHSLSFTHSKFDYTKGILHECDLHLVYGVINLALVKHGSFGQMQGWASCT